MFEIKKGCKYVMLEDYDNGNLKKGDIMTCTEESPHDNIPMFKNSKGYNAYLHSKRVKPYNPSILLNSKFINYVSK
jgi:hypothetical protein